MFINKLAELAQQRVNRFGAQYYTLAIFGLINYPIALFYELLVEHTFSSAILRLISTILCFILLFHNRWPEKLKKYLPLYWFVVITVSIPLLTAFMLLKNNFSLEWLINANIGVMIAILLLDTLSFFIVEFIGLCLGFFLFYLSGYSIPQLPNYEYSSLFLYMFICIVIFGPIFSRNKEIFNVFMQKTKDDLNASLEQLVQVRTAELECALAAKTEFLNNISHEIRTPVQGFTIISEGLVEHWASFEESKRIELAKQVSRNAKRLSSLVSNLLDLAKFNGGKIVLDLQKVLFNEIIEEIISECSELYINEKNIKLIFEKSVTIYLVADRERLKQVLRNLFINAIKFSDNNSEIVASVRPSEITYGENIKAQGLHFKIKDKGIGIPEDEINTIFLPFTQSSRTKTGAGGSGLGLAICQQIIEAHYGKIWAESKSKVGACFNFVIPITQTHMLGQQAIAEINSESEPLTALAAKSATILIIDDENACLLSMELLLLGTGYNLVKANGGKAGLDYLKNNLNKIDVILLDLMMPDIYGLNVLQELKNDQKLKNIPVILQTGVSDNSEIERAYSMGIFSCIKKPYMKNTIITEINRAIMI